MRDLWGLVWDAGSRPQGGAGTVNWGRRQPFYPTEEAAITAAEAYLRRYPGGRMFVAKISCLVSLPPAEAVVTRGPFVG